MIRNSHKVQIRQCIFQLQVLEASASIRFPCTFFVQWKTSNGQHSTSSPNRHRAINGKITFNQRIQLTTHLIYDLNSQFYGKKESIVMLNLVSNSRPSEPKLVGRVIVELSKVANTTHYQDHEIYHLEYCSVQGTMTFRIKLKSQMSTNISPSEFQKSQLSQYQAVSSQKASSRVEIKEETQSVSGKSNKATPTVRLGQSKFQERINKLKTETEVIKNSKQPEGINISIKPISDMLKSQIRVNEQKNILQAQKSYANSAIFMPQLSKEAKEFDSGKSLQNHDEIVHIPIKNDKDSIILNNNQKKIPQQGKNGIKLSVVQKQTLQFKSSKHVNKDQSIEGGFNKQKDYIEQQIKLQLYHQKSENEVSRAHEQSQNMNKFVGQQLKQKNLEIQSLKQQNNLLREQSIQLRNQLEALGLKMQDLVGQNLMKCNEKDQLQYQLVKLKQQLQNNKQNAQDKERILMLQLYNKGLLQQIQEFARLNTGEIKEHQNSQLIGLMSQLQQLKNELKEKDQIIQHLNQEHILQPNRQVAETDFNALQKDSQNLLVKHQLQTQQIKHKNTKLQLQELRQWYNQIQLNNQALQSQNSSLKTESQNLQNQLNQVGLSSQSVDKNIQDLGTFNEMELLREEIKRKDEELLQKQEDINAIKALFDEYEIYECKDKNLIQENKEKQMTKQMQIEQLKLYLSQRKAVQTLQMRQLEQYKKELQHVQQRFMEQSSQISLCKQQIQVLKTTLKEQQKLKKTSLFDLKKKDEEIENQVKRFNDLIRRIKDKQEQIAKLQREKEHFDLISKQNAFVIEQNKERIKKLQAERLDQIDKNRKIEKQCNTLRQFNNLHQSEIQLLTKQTLKLKQTLQKQLKSRKEVQKSIIQVEQANLKDDKILILEQKVQGLSEFLSKQIERQQYYIQRQRQLKQNMSIVEFQSQKITSILQQRQQNEERLIQSVISLSKDIGFLKNRIDQLQKQLNIQYERNQGLEIQLELLNSYQDGQDKTEIEEINKRLVEKNKQLLVQLQQRNKELIAKEQANISSKQLEMKQMISESRLKKQKDFFESQQESLKQQLQLLSQKNNEQFLLINSLLEKERELSLKLNEIQPKLMLQRQKSDTLFKENQRLNESFTRLNGQFAGKNQKYERQVLEKIKNSNEMVGNFQKNVQTLEKDRKELQDKISKLKQDNRKLKEECNVYQCQIKGYDAKIVEQQYKIKEYTIQIDQISQFNHSKELQLLKIGEENASREFELQRVNEQMNQKQFELHMMKERFAQLQLIVQQKNQQINQLTHELSTIMQKSHLNNNINKVTQSPHKNHRENQQIIKDLENQDITIKYEAKIFQLSAQIENLHEKQFVQQKQIISLSEQLLNLKYSIQQELQHSSLLQKELSQLKNSDSDNIFSLKELQQKEYKLNMEVLQYKEREIHLNNQIIASQNIIRKLTSQIEGFRKNTINQVSSQHSSPINKFKESPASQFKKSVNMASIVEELQAIIMKRKEEEDVQNALRLVIDNNSLQYDRMEKWNKQRGVIQEKAKVSSKQLQKLKSSIMKMPNRTMAQKSHLNNLLKPIQLSINELIRLSETLSQMNMQEQTQEFEQSM